MRDKMINVIYVKKTLFNEQYIEPGCFKEKIL